MSTVKEVMTAEIVTIGPQATIGEAVRLLLKHHCSSLPVTDSSGALLGIITEYSLMHLVREARRAGEAVQDHMTTNVICVAEDDALDAVLDQFTQAKLRHAPVVRDGRVVGMISRRDLLHYACDTRLADDAHSRVPSFVVALVDNDAAATALISRLILDAIGGTAQIKAFNDGITARQWLQNNPCDLLITDIDLAALSGLDLVRVVKKRDPWTQAFVMTRHRSIREVADAMRAGATDYLFKPVEKADVVRQLRTAVRVYGRWAATLHAALETEHQRPAEPASTDPAPAKAR